MNINIIENLRFDIDGCLVNESGDAIHVRQGDMDGACGPYCLMMALLILGDICRSDVIGCNYDNRTKIGKLHKFMSERHDNLFKSGTYLDELNLLLEAYNIAVGLPEIDTPKKLLASTVEWLSSEQKPCIIGIKGKADSGLFHWVVSIGYCDESIYLLDPGLDLQQGAAWNAILTRHPSSNRYGYLYITPDGSEEVEIDDILKIL